MKRIRILSTNHWLFCSWLLAILLTPIANAQQSEAEPVVCSENNEPLAISYGEYTSECIIDPGTDLPSVPI